MNETPSQNEIESQVRAHIDRLKNRVEVKQNFLSIPSENVDPQYVAEDNIAINQVNTIIKHNAFKKKLCRGLGKTSSDLEQLTKPLVRVLLPVSAIKSSVITLLGSTWTFASLPIGIVGVSLLGIYLARFGIGYFCGEKET